MLSIPFDNSYARLPKGMFARQNPVPVSTPDMIAFNDDLAAELGITGTDDPKLALYFAGSRVPEGAEPLAQLYSGHQFGSFNPNLGDGRAVLLGEVIDQNGQRRDIQLKGSGQTPFSRRGDGRAWLGPVLREYIVSEAMFALGVPTTRALAATRTGDPVFRETALPGAVLTRVAASHIRVGTFQAFYARNDIDNLSALFDHARDRHYPQARDASDFLQSVIEAQAALVAHWMSLGFIHGVMNTDNCAISGETIDYGPCAFLDGFDAGKVFSSIDHRGRYAYVAQADIIVWNMAQLASALVPLMPNAEAAVEQFTAQIHAMPALIRANWLGRFGAKLGLAAPAPDDADLITDLLTLMQNCGADFTNTFRGLTQDDIPTELRAMEGYADWHAAWQERLQDEQDAPQRMDATNPVLIPRNHRIEEMISAATNGDDTLFHRLHRALKSPFAADPEFADLTQPPAPEEEVEATFCGT
ncbi:MAG: YdiU family protein [Pelagimonas sp.]|jgi:uncharacterized protein YdiU (UPF0061 family)|nr:YdiU family protein [Pelagimonas sp.]